MHTIHSEALATLDRLDAEHDYDAEAPTLRVPTFGPTFDSVIDCEVGS